MPRNNPYQDENLRQAYDTGYDDVYMWYPCPFKKDTPECDAWQRGFSDGEKDYGEDE